MTIPRDGSKNTAREKPSPFLEEVTMTYAELFQLKFKKGLSTYELVRRYPDQIERVTEVALLDVPETVLREIISEEARLLRLIRLKRRFFGPKGNLI